MRWEQVVHNDEMNLPPMRQLDPMQPIEPRQEGMRVLLDVFVVLFQDLPQELVFGMSNRLDDEPVVSREIKERTRFPWRTEFREDVFRRERDEVVGGVEEKVFSEFSENPRGVIFKLEVVPNRGSQLVSDAVQPLSVSFRITSVVRKREWVRNSHVKRELVSRSVISIRQRSRRFRLTPRDLNTKLKSPFSLISPQSPCTEEKVGSEKKKLTPILIPVNMLYMRT